MHTTTADRREILKKKHQIAIKQLDALHVAIDKLENAYQTAHNYPHIRLTTIRAFELAFHALCGYMAERVGMIYEFEQPEYSAGLIFEKAANTGVISRDEYIESLELIAVYGMTGQVYDGDIAEEVCSEIMELFPVMCTVGKYTPEDIRS